MKIELKQIQKLDIVNSVIIINVEIIIKVWRINNKISLDV